VSTSKSSGRKGRKEEGKGEEGRRKEQGEYIQVLRGDRSPWNIPYRLIGKLADSACSASRTMAAQTATRPATW